MKPKLDHIGLDVSDYDASKAFYESALAPLGIKVLMEPVPEVGGFGDDFPFFWIGPELLRSVRARLGRKQHRGRLSHPWISGSGGAFPLNLLN
jgi:catechol 2,3-dioxygenase-like lactoylglutathione lyase family enzyme